MSSEVFIGLMSGTSVDGLDICAATFEQNSFRILCAETIEYPEDLHEKLLKSHLLSALELAQLSVDFGIFCGRKVKAFVQSNSIRADYVSSHGHTVFHTPSTGLTLQIGSGAHIAAESGISTICDFRTLDVAYGGQGAPLVPIGDELLFSRYDFCLNIGGFANVSSSISGRRIAWDICPANIVLNALISTIGLSYDSNGEYGRKGTVCNPLLEQLNSLDYYFANTPKSLGREWVEANIHPLFAQYNISLQDCMRTYYEHCGMQIGSALSKTNSKTLCTGGGVKNTFLMERIAHYSLSDLVIPDEQTVDYKEALIFAYLGYLRVQNTPNSLTSVTGARKDVCGGVIWNV
ncbi:MAG: anhydro-N-acetylmuramic acid kinase [Bacteroidales bacterium]|nr:anhydro-N-acetylmuramic acid kinase [Bacteroidales bacterium]